MTHQTARAVLRLLERRDRVTAELRRLDDAILANSSLLCRRKGLFVPLKGPELKRLAENEIRGAA